VDEALFGTGLVPPGWREIEDATGACRIAIPPEWTNEIIPSAGQPSALAEALAAVSADAQDWETLKQNTDQFFLPGHATLLDTDDVFLIATPAGQDGDLSYLLAQRHEGVNCTLLATVKATWIADYGDELVLLSQTLAQADQARAAGPDRKPGGGGHAGQAASANRLRTSVQPAS
jgi:hypothetical protein